MSRTIIVMMLLITSKISIAQPSVTIEEITIGNHSNIPKVITVNQSCPSTQNISGIRQRIIDNAAIEWGKFGFPRLALGRENNFDIIPPGISPDQRRTRGSGTAPRLLTIGAMEDDKEVRASIGSYWAAVFPLNSDLFKNQNTIWANSGGRAGWAEYWSAAFVSYVMCRSGMGQDQFKRSNAHRDYIRAAIDAKNNNSDTYLYYAHNIEDVALTVGDIICAARDDSGKSINSLENFKNSSHGSYHCDIVVGFDVAPSDGLPSVAYAIGGNVLNAVTMTETPMKNRRVIPLKAPHARNWFAVLKLQAPMSDASVRKTPGIVELAERIRAQRQIDRP